MQKFFVCSMHFSINYILQRKVQHFLESKKAAEMISATCDGPKISTVYRWYAEAKKELIPESLRIQNSSIESVKITDNDALLYRNDFLNKLDAEKEANKGSIRDTACSIG